MQQYYRWLLCEFTVVGSNAFASKRWYAVVVCLVQSAWRKLVQVEFC